MRFDRGIVRAEVHHDSLHVLYLLQIFERLKTKLTAKWMPSWAAEVITNSNLHTRYILHLTRFIRAPIMMQDMVKNAIILTSRTFTISLICCADADVASQ